MTQAPQEPYEQKTTRPTPAAKESARQKKTLGEDAAPAPSHSAAHVPQNYRDINGWGADLDPANRPSYPRELPSDVLTARGDVKHRQQARTKVHMSNEHPDLTPVFGESCPPHGLSGLLRDYAYQFGEGTNRHWLTLMLADRIDVVESAIADALRGRPDNYVREKGWSAKLKYAPENRNRNPWLIIGAAAVGAIVLGAAAKGAMKKGR
jgi:hypothetical protein